VLGALAIAALPLFMMLDLASGGTGFGICSGGITGCEVGYLRGLELSVILSSGLFLMVAAFRTALLLYWKLTELNAQRL
jgi:uncharacterized membrane protein YedE/YeeE